MNEEDDMLELLDEDDLESDSTESDELELTGDTDESPDSLDDSLELEESEEEPEKNPETPDLEETGSEPPQESEKEGIEIDIRYLIVAAVAIAAVLIGAVFFVMPIFSDKAPVVTINPSQTGEDLFLYHAGGDTLSKEYLSIQINGAPVTADKYMLMGGGTWPWSSGTVLRVDTSGYTKPASVTVLYKPKSTEYTVYTTTVKPTSTPTPTPEPVITPDHQIAPQNGTQAQVPPIPTTGEPSVPVQGSATPVVSAIPTIQPGASAPVIIDIQPSAGQAPLSVQCNDLTSGCIRSRVWNFGDGQTSMKRNPAHIFPFPGTYNVTLDVRFCDPEDNPAVLPVKQVVISSSDRQDVISQGTGKAQVLAGGKIFFKVKGPGTNVRIGGRDHYLESGATVELLLGDDGSGDLSVVSDAILKCNYSNVTMMVNGEEVENGTVSVININKYLQFETADLTIKVLTGRDGAKGLVGGQPVINAAPGQLITFSNVGIDSSGKLIFSVQDSAGFSFRGGVGSYDVSTPPPL